MDLGILFCPRFVEDIQPLQCLFQIQSRVERIESVSRVLGDGNLVAIGDELTRIPTPRLPRFADGITIQLGHGAAVAIEGLIEDLVRSVDWSLSPPEEREGERIALAKRRFVIDVEAFQPDLIGEIDV